MLPTPAVTANLNFFLSALKGHKKTVHFRKNEVIFSHGDRSDSIFYLETGAVKLTVTSERGKEAVIALLGVGNLLGESALGSGERLRSYQAIAMSRVRALKIERNSALRVIYKDEEICSSVLSALIEGAERLQEQVASGILYTSDQRLARALLALSKLNEENKSVGSIAANQQTLASMIGTTRQRVNVLLQHFRKLGLIADGP
jgi:CRP/FNR family cyclic AMP-dependent transcriptional regulator